MITERPGIVEERSRIGDWELDTMVSGKNTAVLLTLVERKSRFLIAGICPSRNAYEIAHKLKWLGIPHVNRFLTITCDNGTEFAMHERIEKMLRTQVYFALPYHSWERGTNENTNGLIREFIPKGTSLKEIKYAKLRQIVNSINQRPRKVLGYRTAEEVYYDKQLDFSNNSSPSWASSKKPMTGNREENSATNLSNQEKKGVSHLQL